jgi:chemotaxis protein CheD
MRYIVDVGDMKIGKPGDTLTTHALGSCLGLCIYDPRAQIGGLLHAMLPLSEINPQKAEANPFMFVDTGVAALFKALCELGGRKSSMILKAAGCGHPLGNSEMFRIGERNFMVLKKLLQKNSMLLEAEDIGGSASRTMHFEIANGQITVSCNGSKRML